MLSDARPASRAERHSTRRVALVSDWCLPRRGGLELQVADLARALLARGHDVELVTSWPGPAVVEGIPTRRLEGYRIPYVGVLASAGPVRQLGRLLEAGRFDVVHVHAGIIAPFAYGSAFAAAGRRVPTVVTFHSVYDYLRPGLRALAAVSRAHELPAIWTAVSNRVAWDVEHALGPAQRVAVLPNAIDLNAWRGVSFPRSGSEFRLVSVMRFHVRKRPRALLRIADAARRIAGRDHSITLDLVGDGEERPTLERMAREMTGMQVRFHGWQSHEEIRALFSRAHAFVMPSRLESFGLAALEAACAGLPVIARRGTGIDDFIRDGANGFLCDDDATMARAIVALASNEALRREIGQRNASHPWPYDWADLIPRVEQAYGDAAIRAEVR